MLSLTVLHSGHLGGDAETRRSRQVRLRGALLRAQSCSELAIRRSSASDLYPTKRGGCSQTQISHACSGSPAAGGSTSPAHVPASQLCPTRQDGAQRDRAHTGRQRNHAGAGLLSHSEQLSTGVHDALAAAGSSIPLLQTRQTALVSASYSVVAARDGRASHQTQRVATRPLCSKDGFFQIAAKQSALLLDYTSYPNKSQYKQHRAMRPGARRVALCVVAAAALVYDPVAAQKVAPRRTRRARAAARRRSREQSQTLTRAACAGPCRAGRWWTSSRPSRGRSGAHPCSACRRTEGLARACARRKPSASGR